MNPSKIIFPFALKFFVLYLVLFGVAVSTNFGNQIRDTFGNVAANFMNEVIDEAVIKSAPMDQSEKETSMNLLFKMMEKSRFQKIYQEIKTTGKTTQSQVTLGHSTNTHTTVLMPIVFLLSLIIAYPSGLKRKIVPLLVGPIVMLFYIFFKLWCALLYEIDNSEEYFPNYDLSNFGNSFVGVIDGLFIEAAYIVAVVIWIVICVRIEDFKDKLN